MYKLEQTMLDFFIDGCHFRVFELPKEFLLIGHDGKLVAVIMIILYKRRTKTHKDTDNFHHG
jgi:hypothetical protein